MNSFSKTAWTFLAGLACLVLTVCSALAEFSPPPFPESRQEAYEFYRLEWLPDGYPGRRNKAGELVPHPIYGTYVIRDFTSVYRKTGDKRYLDAAIHVADAALARMEEFKGGRVFWYTGDMGLLASPQKVYSGLTQGRYMQAFSDLGQVSGEKRFLDAAEMMLSSLALSTREGGVLRERPNGGAVIEEWPDPMMGNYVLNGWTTAMVMLGSYIKDTGSEKAKALFSRNVIALKELLPLYDVHELANSRYKLAGYTSVRVDLAEVDGKLEGGAVEIPGEGVFEVAERGSDRWTNFVVSDGDRGRTAVVNVVLNYVSAPYENILYLSVKSAFAGKVRVEIATGEYDPLANGVDQKTFADLGTYDVPAGEITLEIEIPWSAVPYVAYPTNFRKVIGGSNYNVYHFIHENNLRRLGEMTGERVFTDYAEKWGAYARRWGSMDIYTKAGVQLTRYGAPD